MAKQPVEKPTTGGTIGAVEKGRNLELWNRVFKTDPNQTKQFKKGGGFGGTAIKPFWLMMRATEEFGSVGKGWGWEVVEDRVEKSGELSIWFSKVRVWYRLEEAGEQHWVGPQWGATELVAKRKDGFFFDEEAAKKSVTDAITKCLSYLGFAGDVHMGLFDDSKYVGNLKEEKDANEKFEKQRAEEQQAAAEETDEQRKAAHDWLEGVKAGLTKQLNEAEVREFFGKLEPHYNKFLAGSPAERVAAQGALAAIKAQIREFRNASGKQQAAE